MHGYRVHVEKEILLAVYPEYIELYEEAYSFHQSFAARRASEVIHTQRDELGRSLLGVENGKRLNAKKDQNGKSINAAKGAKKLNEIIHAEKDEFGKSLFALRSLKKAHQEKDELGRSLLGLKNAERLHAEKDELGRSLTAMKTNNQIWESLIDGFRSNAGAVASHNRANGWDPKARVRIS